MFYQVRFISQSNVNQVFLIGKWGYNMNFSEKKQKQVAIYALLNGTKQASEAYMIPEEEVVPYLDNLSKTEQPFFEVLRN